MCKRNLVLMAAALAVMASSAYADTVVSFKTTTADFEVSKAKLVKELDSDQYSEITPTDKTAVLKALDRIDGRMSKVTSSDQLSEIDRVAVFNDQETINTITSHAAADSRMVCEREEQTGSHMPHTICMTVAQRNAIEKKAQEAMQFQQSNQTQPGAPDQ
jgi:hypothetical protein